MMRVVVVVYDEVDLLDVGGPYEVFLTASRLTERDGGPAPFEVVTVGEARSWSYGGLGLVPQADMADAPVCDVLVIPGAIAMDKVRKNAPLIEALRQAAEQSTIVASVCTGAFLLADIGLLPDRWTTHWADIELLEETAQGEGQRSVRWVDEGRVVTSGGLSSGIAMALHLVDRLVSRELAVRTARQLEYDWNPTGVAATAPE